MGNCNHNNNQNNETKVISLFPFDQAIGQWYHLLHRTDYYNTKHANIGIYLEYFINEELCNLCGDDVDDHISQEFSINCSFKNDYTGTSVDPKGFPVPKSLQLIPLDKEIFVFGVLQHCYVYQTAPTIIDMYEKMLVYMRKLYPNFNTPKLVKYMMHSIKEKFYNASRFYLYIALCNLLSCHYKSWLTIDNRKMRIINYDIHNKKNELLYGIVTEHKSLFTLQSIESAHVIHSTYGIKSTQLPQPLSVFHIDKHFIRIDNHISGKKRKSKKQKKNKKFKENRMQQIINDPYEPNADIRLKGLVQVSKTFTGEVLPLIIKEQISNIYDYMDKRTCLSVNINDMKQKELYIDYDIHNKNDEKLYFKITRIDETEPSSRGYKWRMIDEIFLAKDIGSKMLPKTFEFEEELNILDNIKETLSDEKEREHLITTTKWCTIPIFTKKNNKKRVTIAFTKETFAAEFSQFSTNIDEVILIPILLFANDVSNDIQYKIEYVWIVRIGDTNIGISIVSAAGHNDLIVSGIHLNEYNLILHHELITLDDHNHWFNDWSSYINDLSIGHPDELKNKLTTSLLRCDDFMNKFEEIEKKCNELKNILHQYNNMNNETKPLQLPMILQKAKAAVKIHNSIDNMNEEKTINKNITQQIQPPITTQLIPMQNVSPSTFPLSLQHLPILPSYNFPFMSNQNYIYSTNQVSTVPLSSHIYYNES